MRRQNRRTFISNTLSGAAGWGLAGLLNKGATAAPAVPPPNLIVLVTDDQRWDALGSMGNRIIQTPHLDRMASMGVRFTNNFCTTSICCTSRASFFTGQWARRHGLWKFNEPFAEEAWRETYPMILRRAGYRTGFIGKWGIGGDLPEQDFDFWAGYSGQGKYFEKTGGENPHRTEIIGREVQRFLDGSESGQPFCLSVSFKAPHCLDGDPRPFHPDPRYNRLYEDVEVPVPKTATEQHFQELPEFLQESEARVRWRIRFANPNLYQSSVKDYYRLITGVDRVVGELFATLEEKGWADNTVVLFTSDNGFYLGEHGLAGKWFMHEESIRTPLLLYDPLLRPPLRNRAVPDTSLSVDLAPTLLDYAGIPPPPSFQGASLKSLVNNEKTVWRNEFFYEHLFEHPRIPKCEGVRTQRWKYIRYIETEPLHEELYDLETDPQEERNLIARREHAGQLGELRQKCSDYGEKLV